MRHFIVAAALLLAALIVTLGAATMLENMAAATRQPETEPFIPGTPEPTTRPPEPTTRPPLPEQSRSLKLVARHS